MPWAQPLMQWKFFSGPFTYCVFCALKSIISNVHALPYFPGASAPHRDINISTFQNAANAPRVMWQEPTISFILSRNNIESSAEMEEKLIIAVQAGLAILNKFSSRAQAIFSAGNPFILCWNFRVFMHGSRLLSNGRRHGSASIEQGTERFERRRKQRTQRFPCVFRRDMWTAPRYYLHLPLFERGSVIKA